MHDLRSGICAPRAHRMWVLFGVGFDGGCDAPIGISFAQNRIYGTTQYFRVASIHVALSVTFRFFGVTGNVVTLRL